MSFVASKDHPHSLVHGLFLHPQSQQHFVCLCLFSEPYLPLTLSFCFALLGKDTEAERSSVTDGWGVGRCRQPCVRAGSWFPAPGCSRRCGIGLGICVLGRGQGALRVAWGGRLLQP